jgi:rare lipoprotein A (peptidoglycan hydrolase)
MRIKLKTATTTLLALTAAACAASPAVNAFAAIAGPSGGASAPPSATTVKPKVHPSGIATWFGPGFYGKKTACGQTLTPGVVGIANRTLPCGTLVKVTYSGRALTVPVLDRGPYSHIGADWDLTAGAAATLGITDTVRIRTRVVGITPNSPTLGLPPVALTSALAGGALAG